MTHVEQRFYGTCTKKNLLWKANMVKERFKLLSLCNECLSLMRFKCLLYMNVLNDDDLF
jgi:hypothetical protein